MFLANVWYAAGWSDEIGAALFSRTIADQPILLWRGENGALHALVDRCPHRHAPLSLGRKIEGGIQCGYHGLGFGTDGRCIVNPHGACVAALAVRAFPVVERHRIVWLWMGHAEAADPDLIPDLGFADRAPATAYSRGYLPTRAGHQLISDNILDLTHADYLHPDSLGGGSVTRSRPSVEERGDATVFIEWIARDEIALPFIRGEMPDPEMLTDMWTNVHWHPNGVMILGFGISPAGLSREEGIETWNCHIVTPETARSTHYFYFNTREYRVDDGAYNDALAVKLRHAFSTEDKPMIEAQQARLGDADLFERSPVLLASDQASTRARRVYARLLEQEMAAATAAA